jgi:hypothetical protein
MDGKVSPLSKLECLYFFVLCWIASLFLFELVVQHICTCYVSNTKIQGIKGSFSEVYGSYCPLFSLIDDTNLICLFSTFSSMKIDQVKFSILVAVN